MGTSFRNASTGADFGNLYGLAYKHTNNTTGGTMAGGHQVVWTNNGTPKVALGDNIWAAGNITVGGTVDGVDIAARDAILTSTAAAATSNSLKVGITSGQASAIEDNTSKTGITTGQASAIVANTSKTGITTSQATAIVANTSKTGITTGQASAIVANTAKTGIPTAQASAI
jgi:hypothetical protein